MQPIRIMNLIIMILCFVIIQKQTQPGTASPEKTDANAFGCLI